MLIKFFNNIKSNDDYILKFFLNLAKTKYDIFKEQDGDLDIISGSCNPADLGNHKKEIKNKILVKYVKLK